MGKFYCRGFLKVPLLQYFLGSVCSLHDAAGLPLPALPAPLYLEELWGSKTAPQCADSLIDWGDVVKDLTADRGRLERVFSWGTLKHFLFHRVFTLKSYYIGESK